MTADTWHVTPHVTENCTKTASLPQWCTACSHGTAQPPHKHTYTHSLSAFRLGFSYKRKTEVLLSLLKVTDKSVHRPTSLDSLWKWRLKHKLQKLLWKCAAIIVFSTAHTHRRTFWFCWVRCIPWSTYFVNPGTIFLSENWFLTITITITITNLLNLSYP